MDCCFSNKEGWFRYRACAIIIEDGEVLMAKNEVDPYYYSVGGGVHLHESAIDAVKREVKEETGVEYEVDRLAFIHENFFSNAGGTLEGLQCHEIALYFLMKPRGTKELNSDSYCMGGIKENMHWIPIDKFNEYQAYPTFFGEKLHNLSEHVEHIVTYEGLDDSKSLVKSTLLC